MVMLLHPGGEKVDDAGGKGDACWSNDLMGQERIGLERVVQRGKG